MASGILMQNQNLVKNVQKESVGRSGITLNHTKTFPMKIGAIYPHCLIPTVPTESVDITQVALLKQLSPLTVPLMADLKLNTAYFFVDYRLVWKKFERFMQGGRSGNETYDLPKFSDNSSTGGLIQLSDSDIQKRSVHNSLRTYFGITKNSSSSSDIPEAAPFFAYQMICRDYYTNVDRLDENQGSNSSYYDNDNDWSYNNLFPANPDVFRLSDGSQEKVNGVYLGKIRYHEFRPDYFLSSTFAPMRGDAPSLTITTPQTFSVNVNMSDLLATRDTWSFPEPNSGPVLGLSPTTLPESDRNKLVLGHLTAQQSPSGTIYGLSGPNSNEWDRLDALRTRMSNVSGSATSPQTQLSVTAAQLTWLNQLTTWKELNVMTKPYYKDFINAHFESVQIGEEQTERPIYIGGTSQNVSITEVTQVSQSTDSSPMGAVGAKAGSLASNHVGRYFCNNHGFIIGVSYIMPDIIYEPALPRWLTRSENIDFYSPEFAHLSMQAILNKEFFVSNDSTWNDSALGYQGAFDELRSMPNQVAGEMLNDNLSDIQHYVMLRKFDNSNKPELTHKFLSMRDNIDYSAWALGDSLPPFIGQFANIINAVMPLPYVAVPKH